jgi:hypothetical protein
MNYNNYSTKKLKIVYILDYIHLVHEILHILVV